MTTETLKHRAQAVLDAADGFDGEFRFVPAWEADNGGPLVHNSVDFPDSIYFIPDGVEQDPRYPTDDGCALITEELDECAARPLVAILNDAPAVIREQVAEIERLTAALSAANILLDEDNREADRLRSAVEDHLPMYALSDEDDDAASPVERIEYAGDEIAALTARAEAAEAALTARGAMSLGEAVDGGPLVLALPAVRVAEFYDAPDWWQFRTRIVVNPNAKSTNRMTAKIEARWRHRNATGWSSWGQPFDWKRHPTTPCRLVSREEMDRNPAERGALADQPPAERGAAKGGG